MGDKGEQNQRIEEKKRRQWAAQEGSAGLVANGDPNEGSVDAGSGRKRMNPTFESKSKGRA